MPPVWKLARNNRRDQLAVTSRRLEMAANLRLLVLLDLQSQIRQRLLSNLLNDASADWTHWPMRVKPGTTFSDKSQTEGTALKGSIQTR